MHTLLFVAALLGPQEPAAPAKQSAITFGGSLRERYEWFGNARWGAGPQDDNGYWLTRALVHGDFVDGDLRAFAELQASFVTDRTGGPRPTDEDRCDLHQAFVDVRGELGGGTKVTARFGRQEMVYGSSRLVSVREGPNVRLAFDGVRLLLRDGEWKFDAFAVRPVEIDPGAFDDEPLRGQEFFGGYATLPVLPAGGIDLYCLVLDRDVATFQQGVASERRWSLGTRVFGRSAPWDYDCEAVWQAGHWGNGAIEAWTLASDVGCKLPLPLSPRLGLKVDVASGDRDPRVDSLQTFYALFPRGSYFGEPALIGPANLFDVHPSLQAAITDDLRATVDCDWFWRQSNADGLYSSALQPLRPGTTSSQRYAGSQLQVMCEYSLRPGWSLTGVYARFFAGSWLQDTGAASDVDYVSVWLTVQF